MSAARWPRFWLGEHSLRRLDNGIWETHCSARLPDSADITDQAPEVPCARCAAELGRLEAAHAEIERARALLGKRSP